MTNRTVSIQIQDGPSIVCPLGASLHQILDDHPEIPRDEAAYLGALVNNELVSLDYRTETDSAIRLLTYRDSYGQRIYRHSIAFLLAKTIHELYPQAVFALEHSVSRGLYCSFELEGQEGILPEQIERIAAEIQSLIDRDVPIERRKITFEKAVKYFETEGLKDKLNLLQFRNPSKVSVYQCGEFIDLAHAPLARNAGALGSFKLIPFAPGFVFLGPDRADPAKFSDFHPIPYMFDIFRAHKGWQKMVKVRTVGDLNERIARHTIDNFIDVNEAYQEKQIVQLADRLAANRDIKWILIAGPSSSGKTTTSKRLAVQLLAHGLNAQAISLDNYFVERDRTPIDEKGEPDFEHIEAIDLALINEQLRLLDSGGEVELPYFNFTNGRREFRGHNMKLGKDDIVILEGIHGLNPRLTQEIPAHHKFKIYVSALTQLNLDSNNRISTTDNRLIRRTVRDNNFRGHSALQTLDMWPKVRRGEKTWIFPYQQEADFAFNAALDYELCVLKPFAEPLLAEIKPYHSQYAEALRLQQFLSNLLVVPPDRVPPNSIIREFIGRSIFSY